MEGLTAHEKALLTVEALKKRKKAKERAKKEAQIFRQEGFFREQHKKNKIYYKRG